MKINLKPNQFHIKKSLIVTLTRRSSKSSGSQPGEQTTTGDTVLTTSIITITHR